MKRNWIRIFNTAVDGKPKQIAKMYTAENKKDESGSVG